MLSEEEKKAVEKLKETSKQCHSSKCWEEKFCPDCYVEVEDILAIDTVLNLITKLQKENETTCKLNANMSKRHLNDIFKIKNYEKQIDLMARAFKQDDVRNVEEIKEYFEKQAKEKGEKYDK